MTAVQGVTVTPDIPGIAREIAFESGAVVSKGDLLVRLDTSAEEAQLRALEARKNWPGSTSPAGQISTPSARWPSVPAGLGLLCVLRLRFPPG